MKIGIVKLVSGVLLNDHVNKNNWGDETIVLGELTNSSMFYPCR